MTEIATRPPGHVGAFNPADERILTYLGLNPRDPKSAAVVAVARRYDLDPVLKHVIVIPKGGVYITRDGLLHVAHASGVLDGIVVEQEPKLSDDGKEWVARVSVWRKDMSHPFTFPGRYPVNGSNRDYAQEMALKAAESHALRRAFSVAGIPSLDEQRASAAAAMATPARVTAAEIRGDRPPTVPDVATPAEPQISASEEVAEVEVPADDTRQMFVLLRKAGLDGDAKRDDRLAFLSGVAGRPVSSSSELTAAEVNAVIGQLQLTERAVPEDRALIVAEMVEHGRTLQGGRA